MTTRIAIITILLASTLAYAQEVIQPIADELRIEPGGQQTIEFAVKPLRSRRGLRCGC